MEHLSNIEPALAFFAVFGFLFFGFCIGRAIMWIQDIGFLKKDMKDFKKRQLEDMKDLRKDIDSIKWGRK